MRVSASHFPMVKVRCANVSCSRVFLTQDFRKKFCSDTCSQTSRQRVYREKKRGKK
jgi:hypothetical protein